MALLYDVKKKQTATAAATLLERLAGTELPLWKAFKLDQGPRGSGPPLWVTELKGPSLSSYVSAPATLAPHSKARHMLNAPAAEQYLSPTTVQVPREDDQSKVTVYVHVSRVRQRQGNRKSRKEGISSPKRNPH
ncbi:Endoglucanase [Trichinella pseudospiralis]